MSIDVIRFFCSLAHSVADSNNATPLHETNSADVVDALLDAGASIAARNDEGETALHATFFSEDKVCHCFC